MWRNPEKITMYCTIQFASDSQKKTNIRRWKIGYYLPGLEMGMIFFFQNEKVTGSLGWWKYSKPASGW